MGFFNKESPFDADVEKATSGKEAGEDWSTIMEICDKAGVSPQSAKDCLSSILKRLKNEDPHVVMKALTLLDTCVINCGRDFHLEISSRAFGTYFEKILAKAQPEVKIKMFSLLKNWAEKHFKHDPQLSYIPTLVIKLQKEHKLPANEQPSVKSQTLEQENRKKQEADELNKAIELSLKETTSPKNKNNPSTSSVSLYPSTLLSNTASQLPPEGQKAKALYDFEAAEENELTFKTGDIITITDDSDPNWWKGSSKRGEGLFPSNFVTTDLSVDDDEPPKQEIRKSVQFDEEVVVKKIKEPSEIEIDENKMDTLTHYLLESDPKNPDGDSNEMQELADEVYAMGPLIDTELERVDRRHAQLTQLSLDLVDALNLYHSLMREPAPSMSSQPQPSSSVYGGIKPQPPPSHPVGTMPFGYPHPTHLPPIPNMQMNGGPQSMPHFGMMPPPGALPISQPPRPLGPGSMPPMGGPMPQAIIHPGMPLTPGHHPPHFMPHDPTRQMMNGQYHFGTNPGVPMPSPYEISGATLPQQQSGTAANYQEKPPMQ